MRQSLFFLIITFTLITSCVPRSQPNGVGPQYASPTANPFFSSTNPVSTVEAPAPSSNSKNPTIASLFLPISTSTPFYVPTGMPSPTDQLITSTVGTSPAITDTPAPASSIPSSPDITIFDAALNPEWMTVEDKVTINSGFTGFAFNGKNSISITPKADFGSAYFVLSPNAKTAYTRDRVLGFSFQLNGGDSSITTSDLAVAIIGSNQNPYYVAGDNSVTSDNTPVFSETRLYYLKINHTIPPNTWVEVTDMIDDLQFDPIYKYVVGFYIKNSQGFMSSFYIDDVKMLMLPPGAGQTSATANDQNQAVLTPQPAQKAGDNQPAVTKASP
jgi:hypothetical protein